MNSCNAFFYQNFVESISYVYNLFFNGRMELAQQTYTHHL